MKYLSLGDIFHDVNNCYYDHILVQENNRASLIPVFVPKYATMEVVVSIPFKDRQNRGYYWANFGFDNINYSVKNGIPSIRLESKLMLYDFANAIISLVEDVERRAKLISKDQISRIAALINNKFDDRCDKYSPEYYVLEHSKNDYGEYEVKADEKLLCGFKSGNSAKEVHDIIAGAFRNLINYITRKVDDKISNF